MAGMGASTALMDNVECEATGSMASGSTSVGIVKCEATSSMLNVDGMPVTLSLSLSAESVGVSVTGLEHAIQQDAASNGIITLEDVVPSDVVPFSSAFEDNIGDSAISGGAVCLCNLMNSPANSERGKSLTETQGTKITQVCAICHDKIKAEETAEIKGCEHSYCVTCILRWASYKAEPWCPQCRLPFSFLYVYRALDGALRDYLCEESVCLLLRAFWFKPLVVQELEDQDDYQDDYDAYEENYYPSNVRLGNRRWGDSGYVRAGRQEARPVVTRQVVESGGGTGSSSRQAKGKDHVKEAVGRRARRAQKREQLDKMSGKK